MTLTDLVPYLSDQLLSIEGLGAFGYLGKPPLAETGLGRIYLGG
jgi:hypothetical protein